MLRLFLNLLLITLVLCRDTHRELKGGRSGGSRYSSSSTSRYSKTYTSSYNKNYASNGVYSYSTYKNPTTYTNTYWNAATGRTSQPLYVYYRPINYYNPIGYYSTVFLLVYYDGYGYNFYYGTYGYYEYSVNQQPPPNRSGGGTGGIIVAIIFGICCCGCIMVIMF